jgi:phage N-6-adenine-methyltransferase
MHNILIDEEFKALIPPLSQEERTQLEANLLADGCRDPLVVWPCPTFEIRLEGGATQTLRYEDGRYQHAIDEHIGPTTAWDLDDNADDDRIDEYGDTITLDQWPHILIDGHNRYEICTRLGLSFEVVQKSFDSRPQARIWIRANQYGRRNLSSFVRAELALGDKADIAEIAKGQQGKRHDILPTLAEGFKPVDTREEVSKRAGISHGSLDKVEAIKAANPEPEILEAVRTGEVSINLAAQFVALPEEAQQEAIAAIAEHHEPAKEVMREAVHNHRAQGTGENEWYTPQEHIDAAYKVLGTIDLDPASSEIANQRVQAGRIFTIADDGLTKEWGGKVWMNPPYAQPHIANFIEKLASEYEAGRVTEAIALTHNYTDTQWFHRAALSCAAICFTRGRIGFLSPEGKRAAPTQGQAFFYYGSKVEQFIEAFCRIGFVVEVRNA